MRIVGKPIVVDGECIARIPAWGETETYVAGLAWCGVTPDGRVTWIEGVRKASGGDGADTAGLTDRARRLWAATDWHALATVCE